MHTCTHVDGIFDGPITNLLSILCFLIYIYFFFFYFLVLVRREKDLNDPTFGAFIGRFQSDGAASMAVKGLN